MKIPRLEIIPILIGLLACQAHACQSLRKKGWYVKVYKADYEEQLKELDEAKAKEKELSQKLQEEKDRNNISAIIQEEERILEMMERQELPVDSREEYAYLPAERDDKAIETGRPKYLPIDTCQSHGIGCSNKTKYLQTSRQKRSSFTNGHIKAGEKLLDGSPGGFLVEMVKTIAKPIYNWMISTDNDPVMEKFTNQMLPETQFRGHHDEHKILSHAQNGDGATVWQTMSRKSMKWNPEQNFENDENKIHFQCRKNVKLVDDALKERLKSVSLVVTTLLTSLHDTTTENLNKGFKVATDNLDKLANTTERIMEKVEQIIETLVDSPQVIVLTTVAMIIAVASVINLLIGMQNMKLAKALKFENKQYTELILEKFDENWNKAENLIRGQPQREEVPVPKEVSVNNQLLKLTVQGQGYARENRQERGIPLY